MSGYSEEFIRNKLKEALEAEHVEVVDQSDGCGGKLIYINKARCLLLMSSDEFLLYFFCHHLET